MELIIKNGHVYDPKNGIDGEVKDIMVKDGIIVDKVSSNATVIDAKNMIVMPGGVDHHTHIAGTKVCSGRMLRPEDIRKNPDPMVLFEHQDRVMGVKRGGGGHSLMSTWTTGYRYAQMGYTTAFDPAFAPSGAKHVHEEFERLPLLDNGCMFLSSNNWMVLKYIHDGEMEKAAAYISWLLDQTKAYAIKLVNPGGVEAWSWGQNIENGQDPVPYFNLSPNEIINGLTEVNEMLNMPHAVHLHGNNLGSPGSYETFIDNASAALRSEVKTVSERDTTIHATHVQFYSYGGESMKDIDSKAEDVAKFINKNPITIDVGFLTLDETTTMTGDGPMEYHLYAITNWKWANNDVGIECGSGITPFHYKGKNLVNAVQWAAGLELALLIDDPWKALFGTDHPNAGPFIRYPDVISWLMSKKERQRIIDEKLNKKVRSRTIIESLDREYSLYEIATITRAANAKVLGLKEKGHLGIGAEADIAIYDLNPEKDKLNDAPTIKKAFMKAKYTIKDGEVVVKDGKIANSTNMGKTYITQADFNDKEVYSSMLEDVERLFKRYYAMQMSTYYTGYEYVPHRKVIKAGNAIGGGQ